MKNQRSVYIKKGSCLVLSLVLLMGIVTSCNKTTPENLYKLATEEFDAEEVDVDDFEDEDEELAELLEDGIYVSMDGDDYEDLIENANAGSLPHIRGKNIKTCTCYLRADVENLYDDSLSVSMFELNDAETARKAFLKINGLNEKEAKKWSKKDCFELGKTSGYVIVRMEKDEFADFLMDIYLGMGYLNDDAIEMLIDTLDENLDDDIVFTNASYFNGSTLTNISMISTSEDDIDLITDKLGLKKTSEMSFDSDVADAYSDIWADSVKR